MSSPPRSRADRKEHTRRAILDAALELSRDTSLVALSLRQVAKQVGIVPTAFYRHFESIDALGLVLVEESLAALRALLRDARALESAPPGRALFLAIVDTSVQALVAHVPANEAHFRFLVRERVAGSTAVRAAIRHQLELIERELATDIARIPGTEDWTADDLRVLAGLLVTAMIGHAETLAEADGRAEVIDQVARTARRQLRMVLLGALNWSSER